MFDLADLADLIEQDTDVVTVDEDDYDYGPIDDRWDTTIPVWSAYYV